MAEHVDCLRAAAGAAGPRVPILAFAQAQCIVRFLGERADFARCELVCKPWRKAVGAVFYTGKEDLDDEAMRAVAEERHFLHVAHLCRCRRLTDRAMQHLASCCPELRSIKLPSDVPYDDSSDGITDEECQTVVPSEAVWWQPQVHGCRCGAPCPGPRLRTVKISGTSLTDEGVRRLAQGCRGLQHVSLYSYEGITDEAVRHLAENCPGLRHLNLSCESLSSEAVQHVARHCRMLEEFHAYEFILSEGVGELVRGCPKLQHLHLHGCDSIRDEAARHLADGFPGLLSVDFSGEHLTDETAKHLARGCRKLSKVGYFNVFGISDETAWHLSRGCGDLRDVTLHDVCTLTDRTAEYLAQGCGKLERVRLSHCGVRADAAARYFASGCPELRSLELEEIGELTEDRRQLLAAGCPRLRHLVVHDYRGGGEGGEQDEGEDDVVDDRRGGGESMEEDGG